MTAPVTTAEDRTLHVPPGHRVRTDYVPIEWVRMANRTRMAVGDVERAYRRRLQMGSAQPWPPPVGKWDDSGRYFVVHDGRHAFIAALMLGHTHLLVAWIEEPT